MRLRIAKLTMCLLLASAPFGQQAEAARGDTRSEARSSAPQRTTGQAQRTVRARATRLSGNYGGISCVPYARSVTGIEISGNGRDWWHNAAGRYARGQRPRTGSILAWPGSGGMQSGHVAVVSRILNSRLIEIDHANWGGPGIRPGTVMRNVKVMDVSDNNSWTSVRVQVGWTSENFGRVYPTYGFIHNVPANSYAANDEMIRPVTYSTGRGITAGRRPAAQASGAARPAPRNAQARAITSGTRSPAGRNAPLRVNAPIRIAQAPAR